MCEEENKIKLGEGWYENAFESVGKGDNDAWVENIRQRT